MKRSIALVTLLVSVSAFATTPDAVDDLALSAPAKAPQLHIVLTWSAPSAGGVAATSYDIRYSSSSIDDDTEFNAASVAGTRTVSGVSPTPGTPDAVQSIEVVGLKPNTTYYFAMKSTHSGDTSLISNSGPRTTGRATTKYEGYGFAATGGGALGDGSTDYLCRVDSLADDGSGGTTLRECLFSSGRGTACTRPLTVIFTVGGTITLASDIVLDMGSTDDCNVTVDGSTAPSPGITVGKPSCGGTFDTCDDIGSFNCIQDGEFKIGQDEATATTHVIVTYLRFDGNYQEGWGFCDVESSTTIGLQYNTSDVVLDHLTVIKGNDSSPDIYSGPRTINRVSYSNLLVAWSAHPMLIGGTGGGQRNDISVFRTVIARFGQRGPKARGPTFNFDFRNNIVYDWASTWTEIGGDATLIEPGEGTSPTANIVNNKWLVGPGISGDIETFSLMFGSIAGFDSADDGAASSWGDNCHYGEDPACGDCPTQGTTLSGTSMGEMYVSGNTSDGPMCDFWQTVSSERTVSPAGAQVTTVSTGSLIGTILPTVGTHYRTAAEIALLSEIGPLAPAPVSLKGVRVKGGRVR